MRNQSIYDAKAGDRPQSFCRITHIGEQTAIVRSVLLVTHETAARNAAAAARHANDRLASPEPLLCTPEEMRGLLGVIGRFVAEACDSGDDPAALAVMFQQAPRGGATLELEIPAGGAAAFLDDVHDTLDEGNTAARRELARMRLQIPAGGPR